MIEGNPKEIQRYDRRYIKLPSDFNSATGIENTKNRNNTTIIKLSNTRTGNTNLIKGSRPTW